MYIERSGSGPRAFLGLHGWSGDHRTFDPLLRDLPVEASFFSADLPGCGRSKAPRHWTVGAIADEIAEAAWQLPHPFTLVGNCSGALLGIEAAQRLGNRVNRLVLLDILAVFPWYFRIFLSKGIGPLAYRSTFANPLGRFLTNLSLKPRRAVDTDLTGGFAAVDHAATYRYLQIFASFPAPETFEGLTQEIDILYGDKTFAAVRESAVMWQSIWPQARVWELKGAGHLPLLEAAGEVRRIVFQEGVARDGCPVPTPIAANSSKQG